MLISDDLVCENRENRGNPSLYRRFSAIPRVVGLNFPIFGSAGDKNHITVRFQIKSSPQTEIHTLSSPKTVSALFSTPWIFFKFSLLLCGADVLILKRFLGQIQNFLDRSYASDGLTQWFLSLFCIFVNVSGCTEPIPADQSSPEPPTWPQ